MAITQVYFHLLRQACQQGTIAKGSSVLELGEANWYGDFPTDLIQAEIDQNIPDEALKADLTRRLTDKASPTHIFDVAKVIYQALFQASTMVAIDLHGTPAALTLDLNEPVDLGETFDVVINNGTAEHIFNTGQVFKTIHEHTAPDGVMIHESPFTGWYDHGFYNTQPTLFFDLARANGYKILGLFCCRHKPPVILQAGTPEELLAASQTGKIPDNAVLIVFLQKTKDQPFKVPMQGYYAGTASAEQQAAWIKER